MSARPPDPIAVAFAFADMCEAVEDGDLSSAQLLAEQYAIPLAWVWAPEDDFLEPNP